MTDTPADGSGSTAGPGSTPGPGSAATGAPVPWPPPAAGVVPGLAPGPGPAPAPAPAPAHAPWPAAAPTPGAVPVTGIDPSVARAAVATRSGSWFSGLDPRGWRTTMIVAAIMIGTVVGVNVVNAAIPLPAETTGAVEPGPGVPGSTPQADDPAAPDTGPVAPGTPVDVGSGVAVYPPEGWTVTGSEQGQVVLQKGGVVALVLAGAYDGTPAELEAEYSKAFFEANGQFSSGDPQSTEIGNGIPAVAVGYTGVSDGNQLDGVMAIGVASGTGVVVNAFAPSGALEPVVADLDSLVTTLQLAPGGAQ
jgi:hypothetical protein